MRNGPSISSLIDYLQQIPKPETTAVVVSEDDVTHPGEEFVVLSATVLSEIQDGSDDDAGKCRTPGCDGDPDDGEGWDGYCGNCADRREATPRRARGARRSPSR